MLLIRWSMIASPEDRQLCADERAQKRNQTWRMGKLVAAEKVRTRVRRQHRHVAARAD